MLLLPLVENSFKHGIKGDLKDTYVKIDLSSDSTGISFEIENNRVESGYTGQQDKKGIGLENIKTRLGLIYPGNHRFDIDSSKTSFRVKLELNL